MKFSTATFATIAVAIQSNLAIARHHTGSGSAFISYQIPKRKPPTTIKRNELNIRQSKHKLYPNNPLFIRGGHTTLNSSTNHFVTTLIPKIGVVTSTLVYFSPFTSVKNAQTNNAVDELNPIPLSMMAVSSLCWLMYGLSIQDPYVTLANVPGCIASIWYVVTILPLLKDGILQQSQGLIVLLSALTINLWTWLSLTKKSLGQISSTLGIYASLLFILLSGSPLSTIKTVLSTKSSKSILTPLTLAQVMNTALWSVYGLAIGDMFVYGPNGVGLVFGLVQLLLKILFPVQ